MNQIQEKEEIVDKLRKNETSLDEAIKLFEEGVGIAVRVDEELSRMERKVEVLLTPPGSQAPAELAPF